MIASRSLFFDTNIVCYAVGSEPEWRRIALGALRHAAGAAIPLVTSAEVLQEILHRFARLGRIPDAELAYQATLDVCAEILPVTLAGTDRALEILRSEARLEARDALHVAVMERAGIRRILSADRGFDGIPNIERVDPRDFTELARDGLLDSPA